MCEALFVALWPGVARGRQMMRIFIDIRCLIFYDYENVDLHVRLMSSLRFTRCARIVPSGKPQLVGRLSCLRRPFHGSESAADRIKTPVAAAVSAAGGTWMGPQASTVVSCLQLCGESRSSL